MLDVSVYKIERGLGLVWKVFENVKYLNVFVNVNGVLVENEIV